MIYTFLPFYLQAPKHRQSASARMRAEWPAKYVNTGILADEQTTPREIMEGDVALFQKCYNQKFKDIAQLMKKEKPELAIGLDLCDPDWIDRGDEIRAMIEVVDFITTSTEGLADILQRDIPGGKHVYTIPDGHDIEYYSHGRPEELTESPAHYVWYGNSGTAQALQAIMPHLEDNRWPGETLTVIADPVAKDYIYSDEIPITFVDWHRDTVNDEIRKCNVALNPRLINPKFIHKSNNKTVTAYLLGLPCIEIDAENRMEWAEELVKLKDYNKRRKDVILNRETILETYRMETVAKLWEAVFRYEYDCKKCGKHRYTMNNDRKKMSECTLCEEPPEDNQMALF